MQCLFLTCDTFTVSLILFLFLFLFFRLLALVTVAVTLVCVSFLTFLCFCSSFSHVSFSLSVHLSAIDNAKLEHPDIPGALAKGLVSAPLHRCTAVCRCCQLPLLHRCLSVVCDCVQAEKYDYVLVPNQVWNYLTTWFGGGPAFPRTVIERGFTPSLELYPHPCKVFLSDDAGEPSGDHVVVLVGRSQSGTVLLKLAAQVCLVAGFFVFFGPI